MEKLHELEIPEHWKFGLDGDQDITIEDYSFSLETVVRIHDKIEELPFLCVGRVRGIGEGKTELTIF